jgi:hypothetical protein
MTAPGRGSAQLYTTTKEALTWVLPTVAIPTLRYFQDDRKERNRLFIRDASTYTLGTLIFLVVYRAGLALLRKSPLPPGEGKRDLLAFLAALAANILYAGIGAVRLSKHLGQLLSPSPSLDPPTPPPVAPSFFPLSPSPHPAGPPVFIDHPSPAFRYDAFPKAPSPYFSWPVQVQRYGGLSGYGATLYG